MSIQMSLVFGSLIAQMALLVTLLLPLPHLVRVKIVRLDETLRKSQNFKVGLIFSIILLGMQFFDCLNRMNRYRGPIDNPYYASNYASNPPPLTHEQLASKFYAQRNLYLTGAVLYLIIAIHTVSSIVKKLVSKETEYRRLERERAQKAVPADESEEVAKYEQLIKNKEQDIATLKKQIAGLQAAYDNLTPTVDATSKKSD